MTHTLGSVASLVARFERLSGEPGRSSAQAAHQLPKAGGVNPSASVSGPRYNATVAALRHHFESLAQASRADLRPAKARPEDIPRRLVALNGIVHKPTCQPIHTTSPDSRRDSGVSMVPQSQRVKKAHEELAPAGLQRADIASNGRHGRSLPKPRNQPDNIVQKSKADLRICEALMVPVRENLTVAKELVVPSEPVLAQTAQSTNASECAARDNPTSVAELRWAFLQSMLGNTRSERSEEVPAQAPSGLNNPVDEARAQLFSGRSMKIPRIVITPPSSDDSGIDSPPAVNSADGFEAGMSTAVDIKKPNPLHTYFRELSSPALVRAAMNAVSAAAPAVTSPPSEVLSSEEIAHDQALEAVLDELEEASKGFCSVAKGEEMSGLMGTIHGLLDKGEFASAATVGSTEWARIGVMDDVSSTDSTPPGSPSGNPVDEAWKRVLASGPIKLPRFELVTQVSSDDSGIDSPPMVEALEDYFGSPVATVSPVVLPFTAELRSPSDAYEDGDVPPLPRITALTNAQCTKELGPIFKDLLKLALKYGGSPLGQEARALRAAAFEKFERISAKEAYMFIKPRLQGLHGLSTQPVPLRDSPVEEGFYC
jgi:hypothetical protein